MRSVAAILLCIGNAQADARDLVARSRVERHLRLLDDLSDRALKATLEDTVIGKSDRLATTAGDARLAIPCATYRTPHRTRAGTSNEKFVKSLPAGGHILLCRSGSVRGSLLLTQAVANADQGDPWKLGKAGDAVEPKMSLTRPAPRHGSYSELQLQGVDLDVRDLWDMLVMTTDEYAANRSLVGKYLQFEGMLAVMLPKMMFPFLFGNQIRGIKDHNAGELLGFVDFSLQSDNNATLDALRPYTISERRHKFQKLSPYICNLLVARKARNQGIGKLLLKDCEDLALALGHDAIHCHAYAKEGPALHMYQKAGYCPMGTLTYWDNKSIHFMKKQLV